MVTNLSPASAAFLVNVERVQQQIADATQQISSGKKVNVASDAPDEIDAILQLRSDIAHNSQIQSNLGLAKTDANAADSALTSATKLMDRAITLGSQGANFTLDATGRQSLAAEVQSLQDQMLATSRTTVQGRYIFSGDADNAPAYVSDPTAANGVDRLVTAPATQRVEDPSGGSFAVGKTAQDIFDSRNADDSLAPDNVFASLNSLRLALQNNDTAGITTAVQSLHQASDHLNTAQAFYGSVENRITDASNFADQYDVQLQTQLSQKQDADVAAEAMLMNQGNIQLQASFQMQGKMPHTTLFDFLA
ncbi:MAG TPA: flagellin [Candidatus Acidoferrales bacterium]|jgi:flagellar hook-associated protein 3 FlgL|nr:flagellin [Candidatus Acidoferrales bacterium]